MSRIARRIGVQTIAWGEDLPAKRRDLFKRLRDLGYSGIEFAQVPDKLGDPEELEEDLGSAELTLLGLSGGSLSQRVEFAQRLRTPPLYLYVQKLGADGVPEAITAGYRLALHPHQYTPIDTIDRALEAWETIGRPPQVSILPDTGHSFLAREDFLHRLEQVEKAGCSVTAIHLKDWLPTFGTSLFTFSRGFCPLGTGIIQNLSDIWTHLKQWIQSAGPTDERWVVVEQDSALNPLQSAAVSVRWLHKQDHPFADSDTRSPRSVQFPASTKQGLAKFLWSTSMAACAGVEDAYRTILAEWCELLPCKCAAIWEIDPNSETALLRSFWQPRTEAKKFPRSPKLFLNETISGLAVRDRSIRLFDVHETYEGRSFLDHYFREAFGLKRMLSVPISNAWNINLPELLITLFPDNAARLNPGAPIDGELLNQFRILKEHTALIVEQAWEDLRAQVSNEINWVAGEAKTSAALLARVRKVALKRLFCRSVYIYIAEDEADSVLVRKAPLSHSTQSLLGVHTPVDEESASVRHARDEAWATRALYNDLRDHLHEGNTHVLATPIYTNMPPLGKPIGIICCERESRSMRGDYSGFSITDEILLDAIQSSSMPHLSRMLAVEGRAVTLSRIAHELRWPISVIIGTADHMKSTADRHKWDFGKYNPSRLLNDAGLLSMITAKSSFLKPELKLSLARQRVLLFEDVIVPAIEYSSFLLREKNFDVKAIHAHHFKDLPPLYVDKMRFQQVIFNLLSNAIKYAFSDPTLFKVEIYPEKVGSSHNLIFKDWGSGVPRSLGERVFEEGVRGSNAVHSNIEGDGIGLWVVREILHAHDADIHITQFASPTEFTIYFPPELKQIPLAFEKG
jgi:sugar phosphate isomerase/epimerase